MMDWATDILRIKTKQRGLGITELARALSVSLDDAQAIWDVMTLPRPREVAAWALWLGEDPYEHAGLLALRVSDGDSEPAG